MKKVARYHLLISLLVFIVPVASAQLEINEKSTNKENKLKDTTDWSTEVFALANWSQTFRNLKVNEGLFGKELGERANEYAVNTWSYGVGFRSRINSHFAWEAGLSYLSNGEGYRFEEGDSVFVYTKLYNYMSMPLKFSYLYGKDIGFIVSAGIIPQMFMSVNYNEHWKGSENTTGDSKETYKTGYSAFVLSGAVNIGGYVRFNKKWTLAFIPEYRIQLTNSYVTTDPYKHYGTAIGFNISLGMQF